METVNQTQPTLADVLAAEHEAHAAAARLSAQLAAAIERIGAQR